MITKYDNYTYVDSKEEIKELDGTFSNKSSIKTSFENLFKNSNEFIAILSGEWGIGKTYFWKEIAPTLIQTDKQVYISLFGLNSIEEIKTNILFNLSRFKKSTNWLNKNIASKLKGIKTILKLDENTNIPLNMEVISGLFSLLTTGDFKNIVICFDDIERISDKIDIKDFMGFLSELKENKDCRIILILNENELDKISEVENKSHSEIFALYKEKIVDYEFHYKPSVEDCFAIAKEKEKIQFFDENKIYNFFLKKEIKNIRVMKQCIYHLNQFSFIEKYNLDSKIIDKFLNSAMTVFSFKTIHNLSEKKFIEFKKYYKNKQSYNVRKYAFCKNNKDKDFTETFEKNSEFEKCLDNYNSGNYWDTLEEIIYQYLYSLQIDKVKIKAFLQEKNRNVKYQYIVEKLEKLENKNLYDLQYTNKKYETELITILDQDKENLSKVWSLEELKKHLDLLESTTNENKENLKKEILENFAKNVMNTQDNELIDKRNDIEEIQVMYPEIKQYVKEHRQNYIFEEEDITVFFNKLFFQNKGYLSKKHELIIENNKDTIKDKIIKDATLFKKVIDIIGYHSRSSNINGLMEIVEELKKENIEYRNKIEKLEDILPNFKYNMDKE
ncbi:MAG: hypothetical protein AB7D96_10250 [Arcobacteraceae bacterium]